VRANAPLIIAPVSIACHWQHGRIVHFIAHVPTLPGILRAPSSMFNATTPKALHNKAQGCRASRLPWVKGTVTSTTLKGLHNGSALWNPCRVRLFQMEQLTQGGAAKRR
jgi:hypothetical protein